MLFFGTVVLDLHGIFCRPSKYYFCCNYLGRSLFWYCIFIEIYMIFMYFCSIFKICYARWNGRQVSLLERVPEVEKHCVKYFIEYYCVDYNLYFANWFFSDEKCLKLFCFLKFKTDKLLCGHLNNTWHSKGKGGVDKRHKEIFAFWNAVLMLLEEKNTYADKNRL